MNDLNKASITERLGSNLNLFWKENKQFFLLLICIVFFKSAIADLSSISGASMQPTLLDGDKVWVNKLAYDIKIPFTEISLGQLSDPCGGDVVIIDSKKANKRLVKRIVGVPGDTIYMQNNALVINGEAAHYEVLSRDDDSIIILEELPDKTHQARLSASPAERLAATDLPWCLKANTSCWETTAITAQIVVSIASCPEKKSSAAQTPWFSLSIVTITIYRVARDFSQASIKIKH